MPACPCCQRRPADSRRPAGHHLRAAGARPPPWPRLPRGTAVALHRDEVGECGGESGGEIEFQGGIGGDFGGVGLGFRMTARKGGTPVGQLVVRVDGQWKEVEFSFGVKPLTQ